MPNRCSARFCNNNRLKGCRFFPFPKSPERQIIWLQNAGLEEESLKVNPKTYLCAGHFERDQFETICQNGYLLLKKDAVPTIFSPSPHPHRDTFIKRPTFEGMEKQLSVPQVACDTTSVLNSSVEIIKCDETEDSSSSSVSSGIHQGLLCAKLEALFESSYNADVTFRVRGQDIMAHSIILGAMSDVFKGSSSKKYVIRGVSAAAVQEMLRYLYSGREPLWNAQEEILFVVEMLFLSEEYGLDSLFSLSEKRLLSCLSVENAYDALQMASKISKSSLCNKIIVKFITDNADKFRAFEEQKYVKEATIQLCEGDQFIEESDPISSTVAEAGNIEHIILEPADRTEEVFEEVVSDQSHESVLLHTKLSSLAHFSGHSHVLFISES